MDASSSNTRLRIVVLKWDRLYGDLIRRQILDVWPQAEVKVFHLGFDALESIQERAPDLFITGVRLDDMDGLEHLEPFIGTRLRILIVTSRADARTFRMLRALRYDGIYDALAEGMENLATALREVMDGRPYVSPSVLPRLKEPKNVTLDALTAREQVVLSAIGDGADNDQGGERLGTSSETVRTHRKAIMRKLGLHHKGELMVYALQQGYVHVTPNGVYHPGFQRGLQSTRPVKKDAPAKGTGTVRHVA
jgi:DNA-binding NarL/FixJ family response regulator